VRKEGQKVVNVKYTVYPSGDFIKEQKAASKRVGVLSPNPGNFGSSIITMSYEIMMQSAGIN
jgi:hypothetical protein